VWWIATHQVHSPRMAAWLAVCHLASVPKHNNATTREASIQWRRLAFAKGGRKAARIRNPDKWSILLVLASEVPATQCVSGKLSAGSGDPAYN